MLEPMRAHAYESLPGGPCPSAPSPISARAPTCASLALSDGVAMLRKRTSSCANAQSSAG